MYPKPDTDRVAPYTACLAPGYEKGNVTIAVGDNLVFRVDSAHVLSGISVMRDMFEQAPDKSNFTITFEDSRQSETIRAAFDIWKGRKTFAFVSWGEEDEEFVTESAKDCDRCERLIQFAVKWGSPQIIRFTVEVYLRALVRDNSGFVIEAIAMAGTHGYHTVCRELLKIGLKKRPDLLAPDQWSEKVWCMMPPRYGYGVAAA